MVFENGVLMNFFYIEDFGEIGFGINVLNVIFYIVDGIFLIVFEDNFGLSYLWRLIGDEVGFDFVNVEVS